MKTEELSAQAASVAVHYDIHDFVKGQKDCRAGVPHIAGKSESYNQGYSFEYNLEQIFSSRSPNATN